MQAANDESHAEGLHQRKRRKYSKKASEKSNRVCEKILIAGGVSETWNSDQSSHKDKCKRVMSFNVNSGTWETLAELQTARSDHQTVKMDGKLVMVGGSGKKSKFVGDMEVVLLTESPAQFDIERAQRCATRGAASRCAPSPAAFSRREASSMLTANLSTRTSASCSRLNQTGGSKCPA